MATQRNAPFTDGMELGVGVDDLTGQVGSLSAVDFKQVAEESGNEGMEASYEASLINSVEKMCQQLNVDVSVEGRYGPLAYRSTRRSRALSARSGIA